MLRQSLHTYFFQKGLDHILAFGLMFLLMALAIQSYGIIRQMVEVCARVASHHDLRLDVHYHYALTGEWPGGMDSLSRTRPIAVPYASFEGDEVLIEDGAIRILATQGLIAGQTISLRPALPAGNHCGPLCWVVGPGLSGRDRLIQGRDATTLGMDLIPAPLK